MRVHMCIQWFSGCAVGFTIVAVRSATSVADAANKSRFAFITTKSEEIEMYDPISSV